jgi:hypothetical protein
MLYDSSGCTYWTFNKLFIFNQILIFDFEKYLIYQINWKTQIIIYKKVNSSLRL